MNNDKRLISSRDWGLCRSREVGKWKELNTSPVSLNFTGSNSIFASVLLPPSSECELFTFHCSRFYLIAFHLTAVLLTVRGILLPVLCDLSQYLLSIQFNRMSVFFFFSEFQSVSCGSLHQLGEEQLKPPPLPPRRKDAMSEAKVRAGHHFPPVTPIITAP